MSAIGANQNLVATGGNFDDGETLMYSPITANNTWSSLVGMLLSDAQIRDHQDNELVFDNTRNLLLPDELVHNTGINVLIFENKKNPPRNWRWGVRNVSVSVATTSSLALPSQAGANISGQHVQNAQYLLDGQLAPMVRPQGDGGASDTSQYVIQGATTIAPNGYAIIALPAAQKVDYLSLYPEWHASRYFSYRVETSEDGHNWNAAIDRMNTKRYGPQIERIAKAGVRYLRLTGFRIVIDPDSSLASGLSEGAYWQAYNDLLRQTQPEALALAELVLLKQEGNVKVDEPVAEIPTQYRLEQNLPNPSNPSTIIRFDLPQAERVHLAIYNSRGALVRTLVHGNLLAGAHAFTLEASGLATGVYFYRMTTERFSETKKMLLAK